MTEDIPASFDYAAFSMELPHPYTILLQNVIDTPLPKALPGKGHFQFGTGLWAPEREKAEDEQSNTFGRKNIEQNRNKNESRV